MRLHHGKSGFTLIELLCVCAILLLLISLLLPTLDWAQDRAKTAACISNQRQLSIGWHQYAGDNGGIALGVSFQAQSGVPNESYDVLWKLAPYCGYAVWRCPAAPSEHFIDYYGRWVGTYGISTIFARMAPASVDFRRMSEVTYPATTAFLADKLYFGPPNIYTKYPNGCCAWNALDTTQWTASPWALHGPWITTGVKSKTNITRVDGSARTYQYSEIAPRRWSLFTLFGGGPHYATIFWGEAARQYLWSGAQSLATTPPVRNVGWITE